MTEQRTLPEQLRDLAAINRACFPNEAAVYREAADALDAQSALLAEAEEELGQCLSTMLADAKYGDVKYRPEPKGFHPYDPRVIAIRALLAKLKAANAKPAQQPEGHGAR